MSYYCNGLYPTYVLIDFTDIGNGLQVVNYMNGLGNTSAINMTMNGTTTSSALSIKNVLRLQGTQGAVCYYTSLLGAALFGVVAAMVVV